MARKHGHGSRRSRVRPVAALAHALERRTLLSGVTFAAQQTYAVGTQPRGVIAIDLGNGHTDLLVSNSSDGTFSVLMGNGDGTFAAQTTYPYSTFTVGSLGTAYPDLIVVDPSTDAVRVRLGNGDGTFGPEGLPIAISNLPAGTTPGLLIADLGDAHPDLIVTGIANTIDILPGNGDGTFGAARAITTSAASPGVVVADINGDGVPDLVVEDAADSAVSIMVGQGNDTFGAEQTTTLPIPPTAVAVADLGNGQPDLIVTHYLYYGYGAEGTVGVLLGNGDGAFGSETDYDAGNGAYSIAVADLDNGYPDVVVDDVSGDAIDVLQGNGDGTLQAGQMLTAGITPYTPTLADVNGDGQPDILVADGDSDAVGVLLNTTVGELAFAQQPPATLVGATLSPVTVDVEDEGGALLTTATTSVTLSISGGGTLSGTTTVAATGGVATFSDLAVPAVGAYTLTATDGSDAPATSIPFTVVEPHLAFAAGPPVAVATGALLSTIVVDVDGLADAPLVGDGSTVTLTLSAGGTLLGTATTAAVDGVATFPDLSVSATGTYTLSATDGVDTAATSAAFAVVPPALSFAAQPTVVAYAGATLGTVVVDVVDPLTGAVLTSNASTITVALASGAGGALAGTATAVAVGGVATFTGLAVSAAGTYRLAATDGADSAGTSTAFTVVAPLVAGAAVSRSVGKLDPTFGIAGVAAQDVGFTATTGVAADGTGSVLIGPVGTDADTAFGLARYTADGSLDPTFGTGGVTVTPFAGYGASPTALDVLADGDILVAGTATAYTAGVATGSAFAVAEYTAAGALDPSFGTGGTVTFGFGAAVTADVLRAMAVGGDGTIYLGGRSDAAGPTEFALAALTAAGVPDPAFGTGGKVLLAAGDGADAAVNGLAVQADGDVVAAGSAVAGTDTEVAVARLLPSGTLDPRFGTRGVVTTPDPAGVVYEAATSVVVDAAGRVVVGGLASGGSLADPTADLLVRRYAARGKPDPSFGFGGTTITTVGEPAAATGLLLGPGGTIEASSRAAATVGGVQDLVVARYTARGTLDATFDGTGVASVDLGGGGLPTGPTVSAAAAVDLGSAFDAFVASEQGAVAATATGEILTTGQAGSDTAEAELVAAGVDLAAELVTASPAAAAVAARGAVTVTIVEAGSDRTAGAVTITVAFAPAADGTGAVTAAVVARRVSLRAGQAKAYRVTIAYPSAAGTWYAVATVTGGGGLAEDLDPANNRAVGATPVTVTAAALGRRR